MNRKQKRALEKQRRLANKRGSKASESNSVTWSYKYSLPMDVKPEPSVPGVNVPPVSAAFNQMVESNMWHDRKELDEVVSTIKELSLDEDSNPWSWARNWNCKYVNLKFDMRDGAFVMTDSDGNRINLDQLKWQYKTPEKP